MTAGALIVASTALAQSDAVIEHTEGQLLVLDAPPASVELDELVSDTLMYVFVEKTDYDLATDIVVDLSQPGEYFPDTVPADERAWEDLVPKVIPAGTRVHSVYFHYDNETYNDSFDTSNYLNCIGQYQVNGRVTFKSPVLGIIMRASGNQPNLRDSDPELGVSGVDYCEHNLRHFPGINIVDGCRSDRFILSQDRKTLTVRNNTDIHHDNYRVVLDASGASSTAEARAPRVLRCYPNPTQDLLHLATDLRGPIEYTIANQLGQRLGRGGLAPAERAVSLAGLPRGVYLITVTGEGRAAKAWVIRG